MSVQDSCPDSPSRSDIGEGDNLFFKFDCSIDERKRVKFDFWFINLGLLSCYVVCGLIIAALGSSIQDVAANVNRASTEIASVFVARGFGSIFGSFISAPIFSNCNAIKALMLSYGVTIIVLLWIPYIFSLVELHVAYFLIGALTSVISSGSILLLRKIHRDKAGPWLGALGAALVSAGMIVPCVQMLGGTLRAQFCLYCAIITLGASWLRVLPCVREDVYTPYEGDLGLLGKVGNIILGDRDAPDVTLSPSSPRPSPRVRRRTSVGKAQQSSLQASSPAVSDMAEDKDIFFMTPVASASKSSSSCLYTKACQELAELKSGHSHNDQAPTENTAFLNSKNFRDRKHYDSLENGDMECTDEKGASDPHVNEEPPHYWADLTISLMILFIIGGSNAFSIYIETYVDDTGIVSSKWKEMTLMLFFAAGSIANVVGIFIQMDIGDRRLLQVTAGAFLSGLIGMMLVILWPDNARVLWIGIALYGFASAVTVGFCFNIANRLSFPSATSTSIIMMGSSIGVSLIPYVSSLVFRWCQLTLTIMYFSFISMVIPLVLLFIAPKLSYLQHKF